MGRYKRRRASARDQHLDRSIANVYCSALSQSLSPLRLTVWAVRSALAKRRDASCAELGGLPKRVTVESPHGRVVARIANAERRGPRTRARS
jgi:hypothetical protein